MFGDYPELGIIPEHEVIRDIKLIIKEEIQKYKEQIR
jgi:hypothetical protein